MQRKNMKTQLILQARLSPQKAEKRVQLLHAQSALHHSVSEHFSKKKVDTSSARQLAANGKQAGRGASASAARSSGQNPSKSSSSGLRSRSSRCFDHCCV
jgi:hypothetical protein